MPDNGSYLLANVGFSSKEEPLLLLQRGAEFINFYPLQKSFTLGFDTSQRFCTGWRDITKGERFVCPSSSMVDAKYEQCPACQKRTGFNPAFYHATSISEQQEARNQEPHILYLAYFGQGIVKVGISHAKRGNARLLEQGARYALILGEFPTAHIARHYEAQIAKMPGIKETVQLNKKVELATSRYDATTAQNELEATHQRITATLNVNLESKLLSFDDRYFSNDTPNLGSAHNTSDIHTVSGICIGQLGTLLFCRQDDSLLMLPLKKYVGYTMSLNDAVTPIETPAQQISLF